MMVYLSWNNFRLMLYHSQKISVAVIAQTVTWQFFFFGGVGGGVGGGDSDQQEKDGDKNEKHIRRLIS